MKKIKEIDKIIQFKDSLYIYEALRVDNDIFAKITLAEKLNEIIKTLNLLSKAK